MRLSQMLLDEGQKRLCEVLSLKKKYRQTLAEILQKLLNHSPVVVGHQRFVELQSVLEKLLFPLRRVELLLLKTGLASLQPIDATSILACLGLLVELRAGVVEDIVRKLSHSGLQSLTIVAAVRGGVCLLLIRVLCDTIGSG